MHDSYILSVFKRKLALLSCLGEKARLPERSCANNCEGEQNNHRAGLSISLILLWKSFFLTVSSMKLTIHVNQMITFLMSIKLSHSVEKEENGTIPLFPFAHDEITLQGWV